MSIRIDSASVGIHLEAYGVGFSVGKGDDRVRILHDAGLKAGPGEFIGILGPNGAGKTTLLKRLAGLLQGEGTVLLDGRSVQDFGAKALARHVTFMHQDTRISFSFTTREVVEMGRHPYATGLREAGVGDVDVKDRQVVDRAMHDAGCFEYAEKSITTLSGGERQRVMLARSLAQDTPLLLLDEPTSSLDIRHADEVFDLLRDLADSGRCVIAVMHDLRAAAKYCTRTLLMHHGTIVADGAPEDVLIEGHVTYVFEVPAKTFRNPADEWDYYIL